MASHSPWRAFPTARRKNRGEERRRKLGEAVANGWVRTPPIAAVQATPPKDIGIERITTTTRYHDWRPGAQQGQRVTSLCLACGAEKVHVVKRDGTLLRLSGPVSGQCEVRTGWAKKRMARQEAM